MRSTPRTELDVNVWSARTEYKANKKCFVLSPRPSRYWHELLLLKLCLLGLESLKGGLYSIKAWDNVQHFHFFMDGLGLQREKLSPPTALKTIWKITCDIRGSEWCFIMQEECLMMSCWQPRHLKHNNTHTVVHTACSRSLWMTLYNMKQKVILEKQFFFSGSNKRRVAPCHLGMV